MTNDKITMLPLWGEATIQEVLVPCVKDDQVRAEILKRIRDARLAEVEQIEIAMGVHPRTSQIRREYKRMKYWEDRDGQNG